jgi:hypothetical protein
MSFCCLYPPFFAFWHEKYTLILEPSFVVAMI